MLQVYLTQSVYDPVGSVRENLQAYGAAGNAADPVQSGVLLDPPTAPPPRVVMYTAVRLAIALTLTSSCAIAEPAPKSLYQRLGGKQAISAVVNDFVANVAADKRINGFFSNADMPQLKAKL